MSDSPEGTANTLLKVILGIFFASTLLTIISFMIGQGWFNTLIERLNWPYETLEMARNILVKVFTGSAIASFISSVTAVFLLIFRS